MEMLHALLLGVFKYTRDGSHQFTLHFAPNKGSSECVRIRDALAPDV